MRAHSVAGWNEQMAQRLVWATVLSIGAHALILSQTTLAPSRAAAAALAAPDLHVRLADASAPAPTPAMNVPVAQGTTTDDATVETKRSATAKAPERSAALPATEVYYAGPDLDERAIPLNEVELRYPEAALSAGVSGAVKMRLLIDSQGTLRESTILDSTPPRVFDDEALRAVRELRFTPAKRHGVAVGSVKLIEIPFYPDCLRTASCVR